MSPPGSSRWCPTPEQVMMLEEMYRSGIRTPNATQIQQITSQLSSHGKIECKNVFYWFQNHKARDRQKLRKKIAKQLQHQQQLYHHHHHQFLHYFDSPAFRHLSYHNSASPNLFPQPQAGIHGVEKNKALRMYRRDWLMMVDLGPPLSSSPSPCYSVISKPPLKTLDLFPLTASNLKEDECNNSSNSSKSLSSVSCNITPANVPLSLA